MLINLQILLWFILSFHIADFGSILNLNNLVCIQWIIVGFAIFLFFCLLMIFLGFVVNIYVGQDKVQIGDTSL